MIVNACAFGRDGGVVLRGKFFVPGIFLFVNLTYCVQSAVCTSSQSPPVGRYSDRTHERSYLSDVFAPVTKPRRSVDGTGYTKKSFLIPDATTSLKYANFRFI